MAAQKSSVVFAAGVALGGAMGVWLATRPGKPVAEAEDESEELDIVRMPKVSRRAALDTAPQPSLLTTTTTTTATSTVRAWVADAVA